MTYRDDSADVTLDNANEGIMSIEFLAWAECATFHSGHDVNTPEAFAAWNARQPEIDALKVELSLRTHGESSARIRIKMLTNENAALKAENERLRKDAEHVCKAAEGLQNASNELWKSENPDEAWAFFEEKTKLMSSDDARQAHVEAWRTLDYAIYYMRKNAAMKDFSTQQKEE